MIGTVVMSGLLSMAAENAWGQGGAYPSRAIRWVVPFPPGGATDTTARAFAQHLQQALGQPVIIENRPGAAGNIGNEAVAKAAPDGHTLLLATPTLVTAPALFPGTLSFDPARSLAPVSLLVITPHVVVVPAASPFRTIQELIAYAKANPGKLSWASAGIGTINHLAGELFTQLNGIDMVYIPYKGSAPVMQDLLGNTLPVAFDNLQFHLPNLKAGKTRALLTLRSERVMSIPDVPSMADIGFPSFEGSGWSGVAVPAGTPREIVDRLSTEFQRIARIPEVRALFEGPGSVVVASSPDAFATFLSSEAARWQKVIRDRNIKPQ